MDGRSATPGNPSVTVAKALASRDPGRIQSRLLEWYAANARDLPWRRTRDPYAILVAEVMLQQTQVDRVIPKWQAWLERFPTTQALAAASRADAIRAWQGLGYNLRAVRLHAIAAQVVDEHGGQLPRTVAGLLTLKGIGRYTAGAVACFAYEQPAAMVDTNVRRVLGRVFQVDPASVDSVAEALVPPPPAAYAWNQGLMDLGATVCRAQRPLCLVCPLLADCSGPTAAPARLRPAALFRGSARYYRGRIVDVLTRLPHADSVSVEELAGQLAPPSQRERLVSLIGQLAFDGLLVIGPGQRVRLPA